VNDGLQGCWTKLVVYLYCLDMWLGWLWKTVESIRQGGRRPGGDVKRASFELKSGKCFILLRRHLSSHLSDRSETRELFTSCVCTECLNIWRLSVSRLNWRLVQLTVCVGYKIQLISNVRLNYCTIHGEHKNNPSFQVVIKSKLTGIFFL